MKRSSGSCTLSGIIRIGAIVRAKGKLVCMVLALVRVRAEGRSLFFFFRLSIWTRLVLSKWMWVNNSSCVPFVIASNAMVAVVAVVKFARLSVDRMGWRRMFASVVCASSRARTRECSLRETAIADLMNFLGDRGNAIIVGYEDDCGVGVVDLLHEFQNSVGGYGV